MATKQNLNSEKEKKTTALKEAGTAKKTTAAKPAATKNGAGSVKTSAAKKTAAGTKNTTAKTAAGAAKATKAGTKTSALKESGSAKKTTAAKAVTAKNSAGSVKAATTTKTAATKAASGSVKTPATKKTSAGTKNTTAKTATAAAKTATAKGAGAAVKTAASKPTAVTPKTFDSARKTAENNEASWKVSAYDMLLADRELRNREPVVQEHKNEFSSKDKNLKIFIVAGAAIIIFAVLFFIIRGCSSGKKNNVPDVQATMQNTLDLAERYLDAGLYDQALAELGNLYRQGLVSDDDTEVNALFEKISKLKRESDLAAQNGGYQGQTGDINVNLDSSSWEQYINDLKDEFSRQQQESARAINNLAEQNRIAQEQAKAEAQQKKEDAEKQRIAQEKEKAAQEKKAQEDKKMQELKKKIENLILEGEAKLNSGNVDDAIKQFEEAKKLLKDTDAGYQTQSLSRIALDLQYSSEDLTSPAREKARAEALKYADSVLSKDSADSAAHYILGEKAFEEKNYAKAEEEFQKAVARDQTNALYYYQLGRTQAQRGKYGPASTSFNSCIRYADSDVRFNKKAEAYYNLGVVYQKLGQTSSALDSYRNAYKINSDYERAYLAAARILSAQKDYKGAVEAFSQAIRVNSSSAKNYQERGGVYSAMGNKSLAVEDYKKALAYGSEKDALTNYNLSSALFDLNKVQDASVYAKTAYENSSGESSSLRIAITYNYALIKQTLGETDAAIGLYREVITMEPNHVKANTNLGSLCLEQNDADNAIRFLSRAYEKDPSNFEVNNNLGNAYRIKSDYSNSITYYKNALKIEPRNNTVRENLAKAYASAEQYDLAKTTYEDVVKQDNQNYDAFLSLAKVCISAKDNESAEKYLLYLQSKAPSFNSAEVASLLASVQNGNADVK